MTTVATLDTPTLTVPPGGEVSCELTVQNRGDIVEGYRLEVLGEPAAWATVMPPTLSVYPGNQAQARVVFRVPRSYQIPAAELPFAVRVLPVEHPEHAVVPEGLLRVGEFDETTAELVPRTARGRRVSQHDVAVDNRGNAPIQVRLAAGDPDNALRLSVRPAAMMVPPGQAGIAQVTAKHRKSLWRGQPVSRPFQVRVDSDDYSQPIVLDGTSIQEPVLAKWVPRLVAALIALVLLAAGLWFGLLRPAVQSAAKEAAEAKTAEMEKKAQEEQAKNGGGPKPEASKSPNGGNGNGGNGAPAPNGSAAPGTPGGPGTPFSGRTEAEDVPDSGNNATTQHVLTTPSGKTFKLTDVVLGNPQADTGAIEVLAGDQVVLILQMGHMRDIDYHFVTPLDVPAGKRVSLRVTCVTPGTPLPTRPAKPAGRCRGYLTVSGTMVANPPAP